MDSFAYDGRHERTNLPDTGEDRKGRIYMAIFWRVCNVPVPLCLYDFGLFEVCIFLGLLQFEYSGLSVTLGLHGSPISQVLKVPVPWSGVYISVGLQCTGTLELLIQDYLIDVLSTDSKHRPLHAVPQTQDPISYPGMMGGIGSLIWGSIILEWIYPISLKDI